MTLPLDQLPADLRSAVESVLSQNQRLEFENKLLRQTLRLLQIEKFGKRSEKLSDEQLNLLQAEASVTAAEVESEAALAEKQTRAPNSASAPKPKLSHPGRQELPAHLERREIVIPCEHGQIACPHCGQERPVIGYEVAEELDVDPIHYFVRVIKREKRGSHCLAEEGVVTAPCPPKIVPKGKLSNEVIIEAVVRKYDEHTPVYRQCLILERDCGIELSRQTLIDAIMAVGQLLMPVAGALKKALIEGSYIQADETPVPCQSERTRGKNHQAYMWEYSQPGGAVVFDFQMGRGREGPLLFLKGFKGKLQCDGYAAYDHLGPGIVYLGCWSHARRQFHKAHLLAPNDPVPLEILDRIKDLYRVEEKARSEALSAEQRQVLRQQSSAPVLVELKSRVLAIAQQVPPGSQLGKACKYALGQWARLEVFLSDGAVEIDNNWCENAMRNVALGRRNWLHIGSEEAGPKVAAIASVIETCRRLNVNVRQYLRDVLPRLADWPMSRVAELSPLAWKPTANS